MCHHHGSISSYYSQCVEVTKNNQKKSETDHAIVSRRSCLKLVGSAAFLGSAGATSVSTGTATASSTSGYGLSGYDEGLYGDPVEQTVDTTAAGDATFSRENGEYTIDAAGADVWRSDDEYGAVYKEGVCGDVVATVTVESQDDTHGWAKSGMMISNDIDAPGSSSGSIILAVTPDNGFALQWDHDDSGYISKSTHGGSASYPCELRLTKSDATFTGEYSTDGGSTWTTVGTATVDGADSTQDVGVFTCSHNSGTTGTARFTEFTRACHRI